MSEPGGRSPHPAARASSVHPPNKPREGALSTGAGPTDPQAAASTACTGRALDHEEPATAPLLSDGTRGFYAGRAARDIVELRALPAEKKKQVWRGIQRLDPGLESLLTTDPVVQELRQRFGATLQLRRDDYRRFLAAGEEQEHEGKNPSAT